MAETVTTKKLVLNKQNIGSTAKKIRLSMGLSLRCFVELMDRETEFRRSFQWHTLIENDKYPLSDLVYKSYAEALVKVSKLHLSLLGYEISYQLVFIV